MLVEGEKPGKFRDMPENKTIIKDFLSHIEDHDELKMSLFSSIEIDTVKQK